MRFRMFILLLSLVCLSGKIQAQISGNLVDTSGEPVPFANILLLHAGDSSFVRGTSGDASGAFVFDPVPAGRYVIRFSAIGFITLNTTVFDIGPSGTGYTTGQLTLMPEATELGEVVIQGERPLYEQSVHGMVVHAAGSVLTKGSSVLQVLERSPGVVLDRRNNSIALNGKSGVLVMINGKPMRMPLDQVVALLGGMSANHVEKVELMDMPPARYDAEGSAGIINIILRKDEDFGTTGSASVTAGYGIGEKGTASVNLTRHTAKVHATAAYSYTRDKAYGNLYVVSEQNMPVFGGGLDVNLTDTTRNIQDSHTANAALEWKLNNRTAAGITLDYVANRSNSRTGSYSMFHIWPDSLLDFYGTVTGTSQWKNLSTALYVDREFGKQDKVHAEIDYLYVTNNSPSQVKSIFTDRQGEPAGGDSGLFATYQRGFASTNIAVGVFKADYERYWTDRVKFESGLKMTYTGESSNAGIESLVNNEWINRTETANDISMTEGVGAAYASLSATLDPSTHVDAGLRYEYSHSVMDNPETGSTIVNRKMGVFFPGLSLSHKISEQAEWLLSYTKRIGRPTYLDLASFIRYSDPTAVYTGNPFLKPTITHNLKIGYSVKGYIFSVLFSRDQHPIARYQLTQTEARNLLYISPQNLAWQNTVNVQTTIPVKAKAWWNMTYSFSGGIRQWRATHTVEPVTNAYFGYTANTTQSFLLPRNFSAEISGWLNSVSYNGTVKIGPLGSVSAGIKKELKNGGGTIQVSAMDIFRTMRINIHYGTVTPEVFNIRNTVVVRTESAMSPVFKITYTRSFGNSKAAGSRKQNGPQEEKDRLRN